MADAVSATAPSGWPEPQALQTLHGRMRACAQRLRLPFRANTWRGTVGNWMGAGIGSSIDFQDHRPYLPGDDPRYIDWLAYARSGHYTMKLYREEVTPRVDLVLDASPSMWIAEQKARRTLQLLYFCAESCWQVGASLRCFQTVGASVAPIAPDALRARSWLPLPTPPEVEHTSMRAIPLRPGSLRIFISDLLYGGAPEDMVTPLRATRGRGLVFVPYSAEEAEPGWEGNLHLIDCETEGDRLQRVDAPLLRRYRDTYRRHFAMWSEQCRRFNVWFARVPSEGSFEEALHAEALPGGAVELCC